MYLTQDAKGLAKYIGNLEVRTITFQRKNIRTLYKDNVYGTMEEKEIIQVRTNYIYPKLNTIINNNKLQVMLTIPNIIVGSWIKDIDEELEKLIDEEQPYEPEIINPIDLVLQDPKEATITNDYDEESQPEQPIETKFITIPTKDIIIDIGENIPLDNPHQFFHMKDGILNTISNIVGDSIIKSLKMIFPELNKKDNLINVETTEIFEGEEEDPNRGLQLQPK